MSNKYIFALVIVLIFVGCVHVPYQTAAVYPPDFRYIPREKLSSSMWQLAYDLEELKGNFEKKESERTVGFNEDVVNKLQNIESTASSLGGAETNHPLLNKHLDHFLSEVARARARAKMDPPDYFFAERLNGACNYCHYSREQATKPSDPSAVPRSSEGKKPSNLEKR